MHGSIPMGTGANGPIIRRHYADSHTFQWAREVVVNSLQAEATKIRFATEWEAVASLNVHRRIITDNGHGIARDDLPRFLNTFGGSGKTVGDVFANFGVGLKTSSLPWNPYGVVIISRHEGETSMMWLHHNPDTDEYGARAFDVASASGKPEAVVPLDEMTNEETGDNEFIEDGVDWTKVFPEHYESGTAIVFLGSDPTDHTVQGDPSREEDRKYGLVRHLNTTFTEIPDDVSIWVEQYETASDDPDAWPKSPGKLSQGRYALGLYGSISTGLTPAHSTEQPLSGTLTVPAEGPHPGADIYWWFGPEDIDGKKSQGHKPQVPVTAVAFSSHPGITETFANHEPGMSIARFVKPERVHRRLSVVIAPKSEPVREIFPDATRSTLKVATTSNPNAPLPYEHWVGYWHAHMPPPVREALDAYYSTSDTDLAMGEEERKRLASRFLRYFQFKTERAVPNPSGSGEGPVGGEKPTRARRGRRRKTKSAPVDGAPNVTTPTEGEDRGHTTNRKSRAGMVEVVVKDLPESDWAVIYDATEHHAEVNSAHPAYKVTVDAILDEQTARRGSLTEGEEDAIRQAIDRAVRTVACVSITHAVTVALQVENATIREEMTSDAALSTCMYGIQPIRDVASGIIGQALGASKRVA